MAKPEDAEGRQLFFLLIRSFLIGSYEAISVLAISVLAIYDLPAPWQSLAAKVLPVADNGHYVKVGTGPQQWVLGIDATNFSFVEPNSPLL